MKALIYNKKNKANPFEFQELEKPSIDDNSLLIQVKASSVNAADYRSIQLGMIPKSKIFGADFSGVVVEVGKNVSKFKIGDEVVGDKSNSGFGGFAELVAANENLLVHKPHNLSYEEAAAIPLASITALQAIVNKANIKKGEKVLLVGSAGGVGTFAVQLAKHFGAELTAVCSSKSIEQTKSLGADYVIDYTKEKFLNSEKKYDVILGINGDYSLSAYKNTLKENGRFVMVGGTLLMFFKCLLLGKIMSLGSRKIILHYAKTNKQDLDFMMALAEQNKVKPCIEKVYPFDEAGEAIKYLTLGHAKGKIVIKVS